MLRDCGLVRERCQLAFKHQVVYLASKMKGEMERKLVSSSRGKSSPHKELLSWYKEWGNGGQDPLVTPSEYPRQCRGRGGVTLLTGDPDLLPGGGEDDLVVENVEGFVPRFLGLEEMGGEERRGRGRPGEKSRRTDNTC